MQTCFGSPCSRYTRRYSRSSLSQDKTLQTRTEDLAPGRNVAPVNPVLHRTDCHGISSEPCESFQNF